MDEIFILESGYSGYVYGELSEYKEGYLLKSFGNEDEYCLRFDYITKEEGDEILKYLDDGKLSDKAFNGCGANAIWNSKSVVEIEYCYGLDEIILAIINNEEVNKFIDKLYSVDTFIEMIMDFAENYNNEIIEELIENDKLEEKITADSILKVCKKWQKLITKKKKEEVTPKNYSYYVYPTIDPDFGGGQVSLRICTPDSDGYCWFGIRDGIKRFLSDNGLDIKDITWNICLDPDKFDYVEIKAKSLDNWEKQYNALKPKFTIVKR